MRRVSNYDNATVMRVATCHLNHLAQALAYNQVFRNVAYYAQVGIIMLPEACSRQKLLK